FTTRVGECQMTFDVEQLIMKNCARREEIRGLPTSKRGQNFLLVHEPPLFISSMFQRIALVFFLLAGAIECDAASKPNFIFILADDLGGRDLGCYGSTFHETPNLDRLAATGMRFTQAYAACSVCSPTRASILTGKYPARLGLTDWLPGRADRPD